MYTELIGQKVMLIPDLNRSAQFLISDIKEISAQKVKVYLIWMRGRWHSSVNKHFTVEIHKDFTLEDLEKVDVDLKSA